MRIVALALLDPETNQEREEMTTAFWILIGALGASALYGVVRGVKWVIDDANSYYEQCCLDEIDARLTRERLCHDCEQPNDRKDVNWDELPEICSKCL